MIVTRTEASLKGLSDMISFINKTSKTKEMTMAEIGSNAGSGTELFAKNFKTVYAVDPWSDDFGGTNIKESEAHFDEIVKKYPNIIKLKMTSEEAGKLFQDNALDLVYIDALHDYDNVKLDLETWIPKVNKLGWVTGHDYWRGKFDGVIKAVDEIIKEKALFADASFATRRYNVIQKDK